MPRYKTVHHPMGDYVIQFELPFDWERVKEVFYTPKNRLTSMFLKADKLDHAELKDPVKRLERYKKETKRLFNFIHLQDLRVPIKGEKNACYSRYLDPSTDSCVSTISVVKDDIEYAFMGQWTTPYVECQRELDRIFSSIRFNGRVPESPEDGSKHTPQIESS